MPGTSAELDDLQGEGAACLDVGREYQLPLLPLDGEELMRLQGYQHALAGALASAPSCLLGASNGS
jgi:hypothetical protein